MLERDYYIRVPKDKKAMEDYDFGIQKVHQMDEWILNQQDFDILYRTKVFELINNECDIIIDTYEEEVLVYDEIESAVKIIEKLIGSIQKNEEKELLLKLNQMLKTALDYNTLVGFDF